MIKLIRVMLLAAFLCVSLLGCKGKDKADLPQGENPKPTEQKADSTAEHPQGEHPKPADEKADSTAEHPQGENPKK